MENVTKLSIQNFDFQNFVKEIFSFRVCHFSKKLKILLIANFKSKILCDKILKIKILIKSIIALSDGYVIVYLIFFEGLSSWRISEFKIACFEIFQKLQNYTDFVGQITPPIMHTNLFSFLFCCIFH